MPYDLRMRKEKADKVVRVRQRTFDRLHTYRRIYHTDMDHLIHMALDELFIKTDARLTKLLYPKDIDDLIGDLHKLENNLLEIRKELEDGTFRRD